MEKQKKMKKTTQLYLGLILILTGAISCNQANELSPEEAKRIAKEAYIYGFPMVMGYKAMDAYALDETNPEFKAPFNTLACEARLYTPDDKAVVTPNSDTPYCMMWADISSEPLVISVPEMEANRFYHVQLADLYTHNFAYVGTLTYGNKAGNYLIVKSDWKGEMSEGIDDVIRCETPLFFVVVRTQLFGPDDFDKMKEILSQYSIKTLGEYNGGDPLPVKETINIPEWNDGDQFTVALFPYMDALLDLITPAEEEKELMMQFAKLGLGPNQTFDLNNFEEDIQQAIEEGVEEGFAAIEEFVNNVSNDPLVSAKVFGSREFLERSASDNYPMDNPYLLRACAAHRGLYGNSGFEAIYPTFLVDQEGVPFDASQNNYTLTFQKNELPPVKSFWSLTMYDGKTQLMVANPLERYLLNSTMVENFVFAEDGSLTFYLQKDSPGEDLEANWLPAPEGSFYAVMRLYGPEESALGGDWSTPPLLKAGK